MIGFFIGEICGIWLMYLLQINRDDKAQRRINRAIEYIENKKELNKMFGTITLSKDSQDELLEILGGKE